jgi:hypothetical protein
MTAARFTVEVWKSPDGTWQSAACDGSVPAGKDIPFDYTGDGEDPEMALENLAKDMAKAVK